MIVKFSLGYIVFYFILIIFQLSINIRVSKKINIFLSSLLYISLIITSAAYIPKFTDDSYRYGLVIDSLYHKEFIDAFLHSQYRYEFIFNLILFFIANYLKEKYYLRLIIVSIFIIVIIYILKKIELITDSVKVKYAFLLILQSGVLMYFLCSGLRSFLSASLIGLIVLERYGREKYRKWIIFLLSFLAIGMHNFSLFPLLVMIANSLLKNIKQKSLYLIMLFWGLIIDGVCSVLSMVPYSFLNFLGKKIYQYIHEINIYVDIRYYIMQVFLLIIITIMVLTISNKNEYLIFYSLLLYFNWGAIFNYTFFERMLRINIFLTPLLIIYFYQNRNINIEKLVRYCLVLSSSVMLVYQIVNVKTNMVFF